MLPLFLRFLSFRCTQDLAWYMILMLIHAIEEVTERNRPQIEQKSDERDSPLEQIRTKMKCHLHTNFLMFTSTYVVCADGGI